jgi:hypothetical protein
LATITKHSPTRATRPSAGRIRAIFNIADPDWVRERILGGMSSGEGA